MKDKHIEAFKQEAFELLDVLEKSLIDLESRPDDDDLIGKVFRSLHTLKGSGGMFGFDNVASFVHDIETVYDKIRNKELSVNNDIIDYTLKGCDELLIMIKSNTKELNEDENVKSILTFFKGCVPADKQNVKVEKINNIEDTDGTKNIYHIVFEPAEDLFLKGTRPTGLLNELSELGDSIILPAAEKIPLLNEMDPEKFYTYWNIFLSTAKDLNSIKDVFIFVEDDCKISIEIIDKGDLKGDAGYYAAYLAQKNISKVNGTFQKNTSTQKAGNSIEKEKKDKTKSSSAESVSSIRVSSDKLDLLVNLVGELVTVQARLAQLAGKDTGGELNSVSEDVERLTWELRDNALSIRMLPIGSTFSKFSRLLRDLSKELGKEVELVAEGGETELDKNVIEKLNDPLIHIIRNCIDHGIETPEERLKKKKEGCGKVFLSAMHSGTHVIIKIRDNGSGLDKKAILQKAIEREIIPPESELKDKEIYNLIFKAGFSTAKTVTNVSGRGVGMDVVKNAVEALRGTVEVESQPGEGTTIILKLPLTLAIIEGLIVRIDKDYFVIPLSFVEECIELTAETKKKTNGRNLLNVRNEIVPFIPLRKKFSIHNNSPEIEQVVVINDTNFKIGLVVDEIIGEHQTVIKSLGKYYKNIEMMSGATVLGDGTVALIIDVPKLVFSEVKEEELLLK
ncbi:MAG: chemotaxis protein CheA [Ignavibacteriaceae bacterium]